MTEHTPTPPDLPTSEPQPNQRGAAFYCSWGFGCLFILGGLGGLLTLTGTLQMIVGLTLLPPVGPALEKRFQIKLTRPLKAGIIVACALIAGFAGGGEGLSSQQWWERFYGEYYGG